EGRRAVECEPGQSRSEQAEGLLQLCPSEVRTEAVVRARSKGQRLAMALDGDVEPLPAVDLAIGALCTDRHDRPGREDDTLELDVLDADSRGEGNHRLDAQYLGHGRSDEVGR